MGYLFGCLRVDCVGVAVVSWLIVWCSGLCRCGFSVALCVCLRFGMLGWFGYSLWVASLFGCCVFSCLC